MKRSAFNRLLSSAAALAALLMQPAAYAATVAPTLQYQLMGEMLQRAGTSYLSTGAGEYGLLSAEREASERLGIDPDKAVDIVSALPSNVPFIFGRYSPTTGDLKIEIYKVERQGVKTGVYRAAFTPAHGKLWQQARTYADPANSLDPGQDPFAAFAGTDPSVFEKISFDGVQVAIGHAMRFVGAPMAVLATSLPYAQQTMTTVQGSSYRKSVTVRTRGFIKPQWFIAAPPAFQPSGSSAAICIDPVGCASTPYYIAPAMVTFQEWQGGTMPSTADLVSDISSSDSATFSFDNFLVAAYVYTFAGSSMQSSIQRSGSAGSNFTARVQAGNNNTYGTPSSGYEAPNESGLYQGLSSVLSGRSLREVQQSFGGSVGNGRFTPAGGATSAFAQDFMPKSKQRTITDDAAGNTGGMSAVRTYNVGSCDASLTLEQCTALGKESGVMPRADIYVELDDSRVYRDTAPNQ